MTLRLHCWGNAEGIHKFHAESMAALWYMALSDLDFVVVPSSNNIKSNLPYLEEGDKVISGFDNIIVHLKNDYYLDEKLDEEHKLINSGLKSLISDKLGAITKYTLFLNKENYEGYSRGLFRHLLPFPMQYSPPLEFRSDAIHACMQLGLNPDNGMLIAADDNRYREILQTEKQLKLTPTLGTLHSAQKEAQLSNLLLEKSTVNNMRAIGLFETYMSQVVELRVSLNTIEAPYIFGDTISTSDLLLFAHLGAMTMPELPNQFLKIATEYKQPKLLHDFDVFTSFIESRLIKVEISMPSGADVPSFYNYLKYKLNFFV